ncbi:NAD(P)H-dependent oxidoreductase [Tsukamurella paurometabola]|uniref:NAD(P)H dehydrogenase (Quinone) n=1 Tax=Tsukamurella paurometabola (strain ATCC 8368 / DSM 20162 / CCUG 35730 / CIP 100753 / JCM 10117 / KCTC 9821 / NBRC 16120 / NCIMB 702349 / NCTC 13040) TaxID=521096 RepID=D5UQX0_TSUPD|nr:NAD(P)H-dependent oxidoreductase [Tsukamurella paurometabola]ADG78959.1 NAD(P)H dehydrogenase (quinone) [Tsukamurella paurometabola DSM 20162]
MDQSHGERRALWVFAHPRQESLNAALRDAGVASLREDGWTVDVADLYAERFDPVLIDGGGEDVRAYQQRLLAADLLVLQFPLWWYGMPAILKGWIDRTFERGFAYDVVDPDTGRARKYGDGGLAGRRALAVVTAGDRQASISPRGISGDIEDIFWTLLHGTFFYTGMDALTPHVLTGVHGATDNMVRVMTEGLRRRLRTVTTEEPIAYLPMTDEHYDHSIALHAHIAAGESGGRAHRAGPVPRA